MTETNKSNEKLEMLISLLKNKPEVIDVLIDSVIKGDSKKKKPIWRERILTLLPNKTYTYLTPSQHEVKELVDELYKQKKLSKKASEAAMNRLYSNPKFRALSKEDRHFAKLYYKQNILDWSVIKK